MLSRLKFIPLVLLVFLVISYPKEAYGATGRFGLPGTSCGVAHRNGDRTSKNECCSGFLPTINRALSDLEKRTPIWCTPLTPMLPGCLGFIVTPFKMGVSVISAITPNSLTFFPPCRYGGEESDINGKCYCISTLTNKYLCDRYLTPNTTEYDSCVSCANDPDKGVWTALGCIYTERSAFLSKTLFGWGLGLAGIVSFLCLIYSAIQLQISRGDPEKVKNARERATACLVGLLVIIFSVLILRILGVAIIGIPGFG